jgi:hypothetical protein
MSGVAELPFTLEKHGPGSGASGLGLGAAGAGGPGGAGVAEQPWGAKGRSCSECTGAPFASTVIGAQGRGVSARLLWRNDVEGEPARLFLPAKTTLHARGSQKREVDTVCHRARGVWRAPALAASSTLLRAGRWGPLAAGRECGRPPAPQMALTRNGLTGSMKATLPYHPWLIRTASASSPLAPSRAPERPLSAWQPLSTNTRRRANTTSALSPTHTGLGASVKRE